MSCDSKIITLCKTNGPASFPWVELWCWLEVSEVSSFKYSDKVQVGI